MQQSPQKCQKVVNRPADRQADQQADRPADRQAILFFADQISDLTNF